MSTAIASTKMIKNVAKSKLKRIRFIVRKFFEESCNNVMMSRIVFENQIVFSRMNTKNFL